MLEMSNPPVRVGTARAAPTPPSRHNLTEGEPAAAAAGIDTSIFDDDGDVAAEARGVLGGRPKGTTYEASRLAKKAKQQSLDSATKAWRAELDSRAEDSAAPRRDASVLESICAEKQQK